jgi:hypothetical protein
VVLAAIQELFHNLYVAIDAQGKTLQNDGGGVPDQSAKVLGVQYEELLGKYW